MDRQVVNRSFKCPHCGVGLTVDWHAEVTNVGLTADTRDSMKRVWDNILYVLRNGPMASGRLCQYVNIDDRRYFDKVVDGLCQLGHVYFEDVEPNWLTGALGPEKTGRIYRLA